MPPAPRLPPEGGSHKVRISIRCTGRRSSRPCREPKPSCRCPSPLHSRSRARFLQRCSHAACRSSPSACRHRGPSCFSNDLKPEPGNCTRCDEAKSRSRSCQAWQIPRRCSCRGSPATSRAGKKGLVRVRAEEVSDVCWSSVVEQSGLRREERPRGAPAPEREADVVLSADGPAQEVRPVTHGRLDVGGDRWRVDVTAVPGRVRGRTRRTSTASAAADAMSRGRRAA